MLYVFSSFLFWTERIMFFHLCVRVFEGECWIPFDSVREAGSIHAKGLQDGFHEPKTLSV
jgi:hypothetical protein